jgi:hypothetical protein
MSKKKTKSNYEQTRSKGSGKPKFTLKYGSGRNGMVFINLYSEGKQVAFAYQVQRNNSWNIKVKDQQLMDKLGIEKAQFAGMATEALFFYSKYWPIRNAYARAKKGNTDKVVKLSDLIKRAVNYAKEKNIAI